MEQYHFHFGAPFIREQLRWNLLTEHLEFAHITNSDGFFCWQKKKRGCELWAISGDIHLWRLLTDWNLKLFAEKVVNKFWQNCKPEESWDTSENRTYKFWVWNDAKNNQIILRVNNKITIRSLANEQLSLNLVKICMTLFQEERATTGLAEAGSRCLHPVLDGAIVSVVGTFHLNNTLAATHAGYSSIRTGTKVWVGRIKPPNHCPICLDRCASSDGAACMCYVWRWKCSDWIRNTRASQVRFMV